MPRQKKHSEELKDTHQTSLRDEVRETLRAILADVSAPAAAKASAARTLMEYFGEERSESTRRLAEMTDQELDAEILRLTRSPQ
jgi:hypothetical protein